MSVCLLYKWVLLFARRNSDNNSVLATEAGE
jgi:hypothetical protein